MTTSPDSLPATALACIPDGIPLAQRAEHFERLTRLFTNRLRERHTLTDGYAYEFNAEDFDELAKWMTLERSCCPFLTFTLELTGPDSPMELRLTGPAGIHAFLEAEFHAS